MKKLIINTFLIIFFFSCSEEEQSNYFFEEQFNENTRGWIEENSEYHSLSIEDGFYRIHNRDSISNKTSSRCLDRSWFYSLPDSYEIQTYIKMSSSNYDTLSCGLLLEGNSFQYEFRFFNTGEVQISEYDFNNDKLIYLGKVKSISSSDEVLFSLKIKGWEFELYVNDIKVASEKLKCKSWERIVPFSGKFTISKVDYLRIIKN